MLATADGKVIAAHCNCIAGLGECCSHVSSLLWVIGAAIDRRNALTVTQKSAYWVLPPSVKLVSYLPTKDIDFIGKKCKKAIALASKSHALTASCSYQHSPPAQPTKKVVSSPPDTEIKSFFNSLAACSGLKPAILSIVPPYCEAYVPSTLDSGLPLVLSQLDNLTKGYHELLQMVLTTDVVISSDQAVLVEEKTRNQAHLRLWFRM